MILHTWSDLDDLLADSPYVSMFWFFQRREAFLSQRIMTGWDRDRLDDYVLLPAIPGFVTRGECYFISHFWRTEGHPDPAGMDLRLSQQQLQSDRWSYIWVDWSCLPQHPRSDTEETYFRQALNSMPAISSNCSFHWNYLPFQPRLWVLFEVAQYFLTTLPISSPPDHMFPDDVRLFKCHIDEMEQHGVQPVLARYGYRASFDRDREYLTSWLDLLILLKRIRLDIFNVRALFDSMTCQPWEPRIISVTPSSVIELRRWEGVLVVRQEIHTFQPFPESVRFRFYGAALALRY